MFVFQCLYVTSKIMGHFIGEGMVSVYTGGRDIRRPLCPHLDSNLLQMSEDDLADLHATIVPFNGLIRLKKLDADDIGLIYLEDHRDSEELKRYIERKILNYYW